MHGGDVAAWWQPCSSVHCTPGICETLGHSCCASLVMVRIWQVSWWSQANPLPVFFPKDPGSMLEGWYSLGLLALGLPSTPTWRTIVLPLGLPIPSCPIPSLTALPSLILPSTLSALSAI